MQWTPGILMIDHLFTQLILQIVPLLIILQTIQTGEACWWRAEWQRRRPASSGNRAGCGEQGSTVAAGGSMSIGMGAQSVQGVREGVCQHGRWRSLCAGVASETAHSIGASGTAGVSQ